MKTINLSNIRRQSISKRETEILLLVIQEYSTKEIANLLHLSYETVTSHRKNILKKMKVRNTAGMVRVAFEQRLIPIPAMVN